jgi:hypothetical protein
MSGCVVFAGMGLIVLSRGILALRLTFMNLLLFVIGAFLETLALELLYARIFADAGNHQYAILAVNCGGSEWGSNPPTTGRPAVRRF